MRIVVAWIVALAILGGCKGKEQQAAEDRAAFIVKYQTFAEEILKEQVRSSMKDPGSVQFEDIQYYGSYKELPPTPTSQPMDHVICGSVNAKNSYGGYVGLTA